MLASVDLVEREHLDSSWMGYTDACRCFLRIRNTDGESQQCDYPQVCHLFKESLI